MGPKNNNNQELQKIFNLINELKEDLKTKASQEKLEELHRDIREKDRRIEVLESKVAILENGINLLTVRCDYNEQYSRRTSLRINNIPLPDDENETAEDVMVKVKSLITERGVDIPDTFLDRAHRVGKKITFDDGSVKHQVIVKFTTWHHRTLFYKNRKKLEGAKVYLDLTKAKFKFLKLCQDKVQNNRKVEFLRMLIALSVPKCLMVFSNILILNHS